MQKLKHTQIQCPCGKWKLTPNHLFARGRGKYCSVKCSSKYRLMDSKSPTREIINCTVCNIKILAKLGCPKCKTGKLAKYQK